MNKIQKHMRETQKKKKKTGTRNNETKVRTQNKTTQQHNPPKTSRIDSSDAQTQICQLWANSKM